MKNIFLTNFHNRLLFQKQNNTLNLFLFVLSLALIIVCKYYHEPWRDELHSLCISWQAKNPIDLLYLRRYEGHPYVYYFILYLTQIFGKSYFAFLTVHFLASCILYYLLYFKFEIPNFIKILLPFNYYFLYEFGTINRLYIFLVLFFVLAIYYHIKEKRNLWLSMLFLILAAHTHVQAIPISGLIAIAILYEYYMPQIFTLKQSISILTIVAILLLLSYFSCIPPNDCYNRVQNFIPSKLKLNELSIKINFGINTLFNFNKFDFWNNPFGVVYYLQYLNYFFFLIASCIAIKKNNRWFYLLGILVIYFMLNLIPTWGIRHYCFTWFCFLFFYLLNGKKQNAWANIIIAVYLLLQSFTGIVAASKDIQYTFSDSRDAAIFIKKLNTKVPVAGFCNYMLDGFSYFNQEKLYFLGTEDLNYFTYFIKDSEIGYENNSRYINSIQNYLNKYQHGYVLIFNHPLTQEYRKILESNLYFKSKKIYSSSEKTIVEDENFEIYELTK